ncbi:MAG: GumC family protein [Candidatus Zixiibacteriota bacterium]
MTQPQTNNLWYLLEVLAKRRFFIIVFVLLLTLMSLIIALLLPKWYTATALLLPPKDLAVPVPGLTHLSEVVSVTKGLDLPYMVTSSDVYARMLQSRTIAERIIEQFDLKTRFDVDNFKKAYEELMDRSEFKVTDEGLLMISVEDKDPQMAADLANTFVDELDRVNRQIASERVRQNRIFIEERLTQVEKELEAARTEFENFQLKNKAVDFNEQTRLAVEQAIKLKVMLAELEIELKMREKDLAENNTELIELKRRRRHIKDQLQKLEEGNPDSSFFSLPVADIPTLRGQYEVLYSRVRVGESLYKILLEQLEQAKIQESENTPTISVLDRARPPEIKSRPKRLLIVSATFVLSLFLAVFWTILLEYLARLRQNRPEDYARVMMFINAFFGWLPGVKKASKI